MITEPPVTEMINLQKACGSLEVIKGVPITARRGDVVSLIGSSGSGKSTILRCANLLEDSQQGDILFKGEPVRWAGTGLDRHPADPAQVLRIRTNLAMVFQQFNLWAHLTILQNVMEAPVTVLRRPRAEVENPPAPIWTRSASATRRTTIPRSSRATSSSAPPSRAGDGTRSAAFRRTDIGAGSGAVTGSHSRNQGPGRRRAHHDDRDA